MGRELPEFSEPCILFQDDAKGEPLVLLRRQPDAVVEVMTIDRAHALLEEFDFDSDPANDAWFNALCDLLEGVR